MIYLGMCDVDHTMQPLIINASLAKELLRCGLYLKGLKTYIEMIMPNPRDSYERCVIKYDDRRGYFVHICTTNKNMRYGDEGLYQVYYRVKSRCIRLYSIYNLALTDHLNNPEAEKWRQHFMQEGHNGIYKSEMAFINSNIAVPNIHQPISLIY